MKLKIVFENCDQMVLKNGARLLVHKSKTCKDNEAFGIDAILCVDCGLVSEFYPFADRTGKTQPLTVRQRLMAGDITEVHTYRFGKHSVFFPKYAEREPNVLGSPNILQRCHDYGSKIRILFLRGEHERVHGA